MLGIFVALLLAGFVVTGVIRWIYAFVDRIESGGWGWLKPAFTLLGALIVGFTLAFAYPPANAFAFGLALLPFVYTAGVLALLQLGYEIIIKPITALATFVCAWSWYMAEKYKPSITISSGTPGTEQK
jgi:hypothetical protein